MTDRTLVILRHAKAEPPGELVDFDRPLSPRGRGDAAAAGAWLAAGGLVPDLVVCSPARRTRETWHAVAVALAEHAPGTSVRYEPELYEASPRQVLELLNRVGAEARTLLLIGHNPALSMLSVLLDPGGGAGAGLRTCGAAVHRPATDWAALGPRTAPLEAVHTARG
jgi:phosphohistidine phosphatase